LPLQRRNRWKIERDVPRQRLETKGVCADRFTVQVDLQLFIGFDLQARYPTIDDMSIIHQAPTAQIAKQG
jgi:hypothetical protein